MSDFVYKDFEGNYNIFIIIYKQTNIIYINLFELHITNYFI